MTKPEPQEAKPGARVVGSDLLASRLLAAQRLITTLNVDSDVRGRLQLRLMAICTALKVPGASKARGSWRLDRLIAAAEHARGSNDSRSG